MTALLREPLKVYMPAAAVSHVRLIPRWETLAPGVLQFVPPMCHTRLPAFVCACGERRLILEWPDGRQEWQSEDGRLVYFRAPVGGLVIEGGSLAQPQIVRFSTPPEPDHWTERAEVPPVQPGAFARARGQRADYGRLRCIFRLGYDDGYSFGPDAGEPATLPTRDNATEELLALVRAGDRPAFEALAACLMPPENVAPCWDGARSRLGLAP